MSGRSSQQEDPLKKKKDVWGGREFYVTEGGCMALFTHACFNLVCKGSKDLMGWSHPHPSLPILSPEDQHLMTHMWPFLLPPVRQYGFGSKKDSVHTLPLRFTILA